MNPRMLKHIARTILPESAFDVVRSYQRRARRGLPPTLAGSTVDELARELSDSPLRSVHHQKLTTWKNTGTYRLLLEFANGLQRNLIYKRAVYTLDEIPANEGLPVHQGPPEHVIAQVSGGPLCEFIPHAYWVDESPDATSFDYVWEDLSVDHEHFVRYQESHRKDAVCQSLAAMHQALRTQFGGDPVDEFLRFDEAYADQIWDYALSVLPRYLDETGDETTRKFLDRRHEVGSVFLDRSFHRDRPTQVIHGDCNGTNMWVRQDDGMLRMKAVDWEWAAYGIPHADLISILKWSPADEKDDFLIRYCKAAGLGDIDAERRWLRRANMERAVLDAGFLAKQYLDPVRSQDWFRGFVSGSLDQLLDETDVFLSDGSIS